MLLFLLSCILMGILFGIGNLLMMVAGSVTKVNASRAEDFITGKVNEMNTKLTNFLKKRKEK